MPREPYPWNRSLRPASAAVLTADYTARVGWPQSTQGRVRPRTRYSSTLSQIPEGSKRDRGVQECSSAHAAKNLWLMRGCLFSARGFFRLDGCPAAQVIGPPENKLAGGVSGGLEEFTT